MKERLFDANIKNERDLQLDMELEGTFPASDPLKVTRVPVARYRPHLKTRISGTRRNKHGKPREDVHE